MDTTETIRCAFETEADLAALERLACRLQGTPFEGWPLDPEARALPGAAFGDDFGVRKRRLLLHEGSEVRAYLSCFEHELYVRGEPHSFAWVTGPCSEGVVNSKYALHGLMPLRASLGAHPFHMCLGNLPPDRGIGLVLRKMRWEHQSVPLFLLPVRGRRVCDELRVLRASPARRALSRTLAMSGIATLMCNAYLLTKGVSRRKHAACEEIGEFGDWADAAWNDNLPHYAALTRRDRATLNRLYRPFDRRIVRLRIRDGAHDVGWVIVNSLVMHDDETFGSLTVGCVVDGLCAPERAEDVMRCGVAHLVADGVDIIHASWTHASWQQAAARLGFIRIPNRHWIHVEPTAKTLLLTPEMPLEAMHFSRGDGDGPRLAQAQR